MHVTVLQPLLILAAIAIVGGVPLLGAVAPAVAIGARPCTELGPRAKVEAQRVSCCLRGSASRLRTCAVASVPVGTWTRGADGPQRMWAVRRGACALPPPRA